MKTVYIFIPDDILPESGWIHGCTMCYNPTSSHINEPYEYYNEKINMNIMICNKCIKKLKVGCNKEKVSMLLLIHIQK